MTIRVYNTLTKQKEEFVPITPGKANIYVCGVTPYNHPHIGNARPFVTWDVIRRFLEHEGYDVTHVQNFTDVDDKIINTANKEGVQWFDICNRYIDSYFEVMDKLNVRRAHVYPRVSEHIADIIALVQSLVDNGYAYEVDGDVFYSVEKFKYYGELSGRNLEDMMAGARVDVNDRKRNPMDFALWKSAKPGEPFWESPWGKGRPGWHIECSAMSMKYLGKHFDIHTGGIDHVPVHHTNEIAQSEGSFTEQESKEGPWVNYWLHNDFLILEGGKMSKSSGNFITLQTKLPKEKGFCLTEKGYEPLDYRYFLLSGHYRKPLIFSFNAMDSAKNSRKSLINKTKAILESSKGKAADLNSLSSKASEYLDAFKSDLENDLSTAQAMSRLQLATKDSELKPEEALALIIKMDSVLALSLVEEAKKSTEPHQDDHQDDNEAQEIDKLVLARTEAKKVKDFETADKIRNDLAARGIIIIDTPTGPTWKRK